MKVTWISKEKVDAAVRGKIIKTKVIMDIGSGIRPQNYIQPRIQICVEPYLPYIEHLKQDIGDDPTYVFLNCTWDVAMKLFPAKSVDSVFALDIIEHLEKEEGQKLLEQAERIARRQIIVFTPFDFYPQPYDDSNKGDRWGMEGGFWQAHRSGWLPEDFGDDWELICCEAYHFVDHLDKPLDKPFGAIWAFRNLEIADTKKIPKHAKLKSQSRTSRSIQFFSNIFQRLKK